MRAYRIKKKSLFLSLGRNKEMRVQALASQLQVATAVQNHISTCFQMAIVYPHLKALYSLSIPKCFFPFFSVYLSIYTCRPLHLF